MQQVKQIQLYQSDPTRWNALSFVKSFIIRHALPFNLFDDKYTRHTLAVVAPADQLQVEKLNNKAVSWVAESRLAYTLSFIPSTSCALRMKTITRPFSLSYFWSSPRISANNLLVYRQQCVTIFWVSFFS